MKNERFLKKLSQGIKIEEINPSTFNSIKEIIEEHRAKIFDKPQIINLISKTLELINEWIMNIFAKLEL